MGQDSLFCSYAVPLIVQCLPQFIMVSVSISILVLCKKCDLQLQFSKRKIANKLYIIV